MKINISLCNVKPIYDFRSELENALFKLDNILEKDDVVTIDYDVAYNNADISTQHVDNNVIYISVIFNSEDSSYVGLASLHDVEDVGYVEYVKWDTSNFPHYKDFIAQAIAAHRVAYNTFSSDAIERVEGIKMKVALKQDVDKIYTVQLGSMFINEINKNGLTYKEVKAYITDNDTDFIKRLKSKTLLGELDPLNHRCSTTESALFPFTNIDSSNAVFSILEINALSVYDNPVETGEVKKAIIVGKIKPLDNELGKALKATLDDPLNNATFGLRGIVNPENPIGSKLVSIITWDLILPL